MLDLLNNGKLDLITKLKLDLLNNGKSDCICWKFDFISNLTQCPRTSYIQYLLVDGGSHQVVLPGNVLQDSVRLEEHKEGAC